eukprot:3359217-Rhodomonas_salina.1
MLSPPALLRLTLSPLSLLPPSSPPLPPPPLLLPLLLSPHVNRRRIQVPAATRARDVEVHVTQGPWPPTVCYGAISTDLVYQPTRQSYALVYTAFGAMYFPELLSHATAYPVLYYTLQHIVLSYDATA